MTPNIEISAVVGCRMGCDYCPQKIHTTNYKDNKIMTLETFATCLAKIPTEVEIYFAGMAEPWLNPRASDMVLMAHEQGHRVGVYTTLAGMIFDDIYKIRHIPYVHFCIHLPDADGLMKFSVTNEYLEILKYTLAVIPAVNFMCIGRVHPEVEKLTGPVADGSPGLISRGGNLKTLAITPKKGRLKCSAMSEKMDHNVLLPNGDTILCCCDYAQKHVLGNLLTMDYEQLFDSPEYHRIKAGLNDENSNIICRTCELAISNSAPSV